METHTKREWQALVKLFAQHSSLNEMDQLLHVFLTANERDFLVHRYKIVQALLTKKVPQRKIAEELNVSIAKITAGSNELKRTKPAFKQILMERMREER